MTDAPKTADRERGPSPSLGVELAALLERVEAATGPDRELDFDLYRALNPPGQVQPWGWMMEPYEIAPAGVVHLKKNFVRDKVICADFVPTWTASLDAALALVERVHRPSIDAVQLMAEAAEDLANGGWRDDQPIAPQWCLCILAALLRSLVDLSGAQGTERCDPAARPTTSQPKASTHDR